MAFGIIFENIFAKDTFEDHRGKRVGKDMLRYASFDLINVDVAPLLYLHALYALGNPCNFLLIFC